MSMYAKKRVNGSWVDTTLRQYKTATDTITTFPAVLYTTGTTATVVLKGQTVQSDTPTPDSPIMPEGCGERTGNLFNGKIEQGGLRDLDGSIITSSSRVRTTKINVTENTYYTVTSNLMIRNIIAYYNNTFVSRLVGSTSEIAVFLIPVGVNQIAISFKGNAEGTVEITPNNLEWLMMNEGVKPIPYEPYGYKIQISSANTTTPVYLGEVETTRKIKKLVLTGDEQWRFFSDDLGTWQFYINDISLGGVPTSSCMSNIAPYGVTASTRRQYDYGCYLVTDGNGVAFQMKGDKDTLIDTASWKSYLAAQYAAGTPVTVWYVLATPETGIINEPLMKIGNYADEVSNISIPTITGKNIVDVETVLKPSEVSFNYAGWHTSVVHKRINGAWD